ncbi:MAG TPA: hypothetical protein VED59_08870 [Acidimicrobiales bacterium]|nr:hypothetical protein [Acidimicrobiales bacterium]
MSPKPASATRIYPGASGSDGRARMGRGFAVSAVLALAVLAAGSLAGCSTSATYVTSNSEQMYFKLPSNWTVYKEATLVRLGLLGNSPPALFVLARPNLMSTR